MEHIIHSIEPVFDAESRVLILGTMPSPKSREVQFYYGHPQNRFWRVLAAVLGEELLGQYLRQKQREMELPETVEGAEDPYLLFI